MTSMRRKVGKTKVVSTISAGRLARSVGRLVGRTKISGFSNALIDVMDRTVKIKLRALIIWPDYVRQEQDLERA